MLPYCHSLRSSLTKVEKTLDRVATQARSRKGARKPLQHSPNGSRRCRRGSEKARKRWSRSSVPFRSTRKRTGSSSTDTASWRSSGCGFVDRPRNSSTSVQGIDKLLTVLADRDALEASLYRDIVKSRLDAIKDFQGIVDEDAKEKGCFRQYSVRSSLVARPSLGTSDARVKSWNPDLSTEGVITDELTEKEKLGRVDIAYRTNAGKHIIVELKKVGRKMKLLELQEQGQTYVDKLRRIMLAQDDHSPNIEVIFILGRPVDDEKENPDRVKASMTAVSPGSRIVHYDALIQGAQSAYSGYLEKSKELDRLEMIVDRV